MKIIAFLVMIFITLTLAFGATLTVELIKTPEKTAAQSVFLVLTPNGERLGQAWCAADFQGQKILETDAHVVGDYQDVILESSETVAIAGGKVVFSDKKEDIAFLSSKDVSCQPLPLSLDPEGPKKAEVFAVSQRGENGDHFLLTAVRRGKYLDGAAYRGQITLFFNLPWVTDGDSGAPIIQAGKVVGVILAHADEVDLGDAVVYKDVIDAAEPLTIFRLLKEAEDRIKK